MKTAAATLAFILCSAPAFAIERTRDVMSRFDLATMDCHRGQPRACAERDRVFHELRDRGLTLVRDPENPNGYVWQ